MDEAKNVKVCIDVGYVGDEATVAAVLFQEWSDSAPCGELVVATRVPSDYEPGSFYKRELPCIQRLLEKLEDDPGFIVVDGYVWLGEGRPGLGAHLYSAIGGQSVVIGVAKNWFAGSCAVPVKRGGSERPLYVTSEGIPVEDAAEYIRSMDGDFRVPALIKRADQLSRGNVG